MVEHPAKGLECFCDANSVGDHTEKVKHGEDDDTQSRCLGTSIRQDAVSIRLEKPGEGVIVDALVDILIDHLVLAIVLVHILRES